MTTLTAAQGLEGMPCSHTVQSCYAVTWAIPKLEACRQSACRRQSLVNSTVVLLSIRDLIGNHRRDPRHTTSHGRRVDGEDTEPLPPYLSILFRVPRRPYITILTEWLAEEIATRVSDDLLESSPSNKQV